MEHVSKTLKPLVFDLLVKSNKVDKEKNEESIMDLVEDIKDLSDEILEEDE